MRLAAWLVAAVLLAACQPAKVSSPPPGQQAETSIPPTFEPAPAAPATATTAPAEPLPAPAPTGPATVALLLPLSGERAALGRDLLDAATLALFDLARDDLLLLPKDTGGTPAQAAAMATAALSEGARLVLGPVFAPEVGAVAPIATAAGVPIVAFSSDRRVAAAGIFVFGLAPEDQIDQVVAYAAGQGRTRFAALAPDTDTGRIMVRALAGSTALRGVLMAQPGYYAPGAIDQNGAVGAFADIGTRGSAIALQRAALEGRDDEAAQAARARLDQAAGLGELGYDAVLLPDAGSSLRSVAALLPFFDIAPPGVQVLGTAAWDDPKTLAEPGLTGAWFAAPDPALKTAFAQRFEAAFGRKPLAVASLAYDAIALAGALVATAPEAPFTVDRLTRPSGFAGIDGVFRFHADGTSQRTLAIYQVREGGAELIAPAAASFATPTQ
jgi:ABC-type branched-subunit amino acid transport system substrate-binding protein